MLRKSTSQSLFHIHHHYGGNFKEKQQPLLFWNIFIFQNTNVTFHCYFDIFIIIRFEKFSWTFAFKVNDNVNDLQMCIKFKLNVGLMVPLQAFSNEAGDVNIQNTTCCASFFKSTQQVDFTPFSENYLLIWRQLSFVQIFDVLFVRNLLSIKFMFLTSDAGRRVGGLQLDSFRFIVWTSNQL